MSMYRFYGKNCHVSKFCHTIYIKHDIAWFSQTIGVQDLSHRR